MGCKIVAAAFSACEKGCGRTAKAVSMAVRVFAIIPQRKRRSDTTQYVPDLRVAKAGWGLPVALLLVFPASTLQRKKPLQCHRFPRAREGLLARETISPADNLPKHQSGRAFTKRLLPQASSVASHPRCALSRSGTASFPVLPFRADAYQNPLLRFVRSSFSPACV